ncbi:unnamed protein product [Cladocopium goreaui]|uniref:Uncharacterized protein n=1 Tax=Cladocopium goreaui TaxID=2562237 RepID=A0A9P1G7W3_9DINO|nr:unnamed protein product [Cladocopium goreaui]
MALKSGVFACLLLALRVSCDNAMPQETEKSRVPFPENLKETEKSGSTILALGSGAEHTNRTDIASQNVSLNNAPVHQLKVGRCSCRANTCGTGDHPRCCRCCPAWSEACYRR